MTKRIVICLAAALAFWVAPARATDNVVQRCQSGPGLEEDLVRRLAEHLGACPLLSLGASDARSLAEARPGTSIVNLRLDMRIGTWSATMVEFRGDGSTKVVRQLRGSVSTARDIPVVTRRIIPGEVIDVADVRVIPVDARHIPPNAVLDASQLIGLEPRWPIAPLSPVSRSQVKSILAVERGAGVRALVRRAGIELTTNLIAIDGGTIGQTITLRNPSSNKLVRGTIADTGMVVLE